MHREGQISRAHRRHKISETPPLSVHSLLSLSLSSFFPSKQYLYNLEEEQQQHYLQLEDDEGEQERGRRNQKIL
jgi:hypothetical protein